MNKEKRPPRENLYRAIFPGVELREAGDSDGPTMAGHFAVFNQWTEINSIFEGRFMERFDAGAFKKTIKENRDGMRVLFQHGRDPSVGDKPLGPIDTLREDDQGAYYEVPLLDAGYVRDDVLPGLEAGLYGASFRFRVIREEINEKPKRSATNPDGIPERTVKEAEVREFGPVTFPAYAGASAGVRSLTDEFLYERLVSDPERRRELAEFMARALTDEDTASPAEGEQPEDRGEPAPEADAEERETEEDAPPTDSAEAEPHSDQGRRAHEGKPLYGTPDRDQTPAWRL